MLSRIMRHPAGLMRMAWGRTFLRDAFQGPVAAPPAPPDWWPGRYSAEGLLIAPPAPPPPAADADAPVSVAPRALDGHGGKAASFLSAGG